MQVGNQGGGSNALIAQNVHGHKKSFSTNLQLSGGGVVGTSGSGNMKIVKPSELNLDLIKPQSIKGMKANNLIATQNVGPPGSVSN